MKATLASLPLLVVAVAGVSYGTYAFFSDSEGATANVFTAGSMDLTVNGRQGVTAAIGGVNFAPGDAAGGTIRLRNEGSIYTTSAGSTQEHSVDLDLKMAVRVVDDAGNPEDPDDGAASGNAFARYLTLTTLRYDRQDLLPRVADLDGDGRRPTLADLALAPAFVDMADPGAAGRTMAMSVRFANDGSNALKRDAAIVDITFFLAQTAEADLR